MLTITDFLSQRLWSITDNVVAGVIILAIVALAARLPRPHSEWLKYALYVNAAAVMIIMSWLPQPISASKFLDITGMAAVCSIYVATALLPVTWLRWFALLLPLSIDAFGTYLLYRDGYADPLMAGILGYPVMYTLSSLLVVIAHIVALRSLMRRETVHQA